LFKALLALKPHQEDISNIKNFVWRFCVNYIQLNMVTCVIAYPIPQCDTAVHSEFGCGASGFMWLYNAPQGYHQLQVAMASQPKLAFERPDAMVPIGDLYNSCVTVDDLGATLALSLLYICCQLTVCQAYNLSLSLKKMRIFPKRFAFVDVTPGGHLPAQSKHVLLGT
jgi:hypothetical protein